MQDPARIRDLVRKVVYRTLGRSTDSQSQRSSASLVTEQDVKQLPFGGELRVPNSAIITPLARQAAMDHHITLLMDDESTSEALSIKPASRVTHDRIESVGHHYQPPQRTTERLVDETDLKDLPYGAEIRVPPGSIVTPLARQMAMDRRVTIIEGAPSQPISRTEPKTSGPVTGSDEHAIAIGADHGGVSMKTELIAYLREQNYEVLDCGTNSTDSVDYPDYALAVAQLVANGGAWRGIIIDGAGIGSCMAANKVPGIRAAMCYDQATALNSREHNNANVLTLGAGMLGGNLTRQIVQTWLDTEFGGGRHARRVDKIMDIERRYSK